MSKPKPKPKATSGGFRNPHNLPVKVCAACQRPFTWRKKWAASWEQVKFCSDACRKSGGANSRT